MIRVCELDVVNDAVMDDGVASDDLALLKGGGVEVTLVSRAAPSSLRGVAKDQ
jgi:hypothetical protein